MKGVILAGGNGTRLQPMTLVTNKHLLPVYDRPMVYYPIKTLTDAGISDIMIITGSEHAGDFLNLLGTGAEFGAQFTYRVQDTAGGIADALGLCREFAGDDPVAVILGDNIFDFSISSAVASYDPHYAEIFLASVPDPERFGVATIKGDRITHIAEKPETPDSPFAVTGLYIYPNDVWGIIDTLVPSTRGELEITDVNQFYVMHNRMRHRIVEDFWSDAGTPESLFTASRHVREKKYENTKKHST